MGLFYIYRDCVPLFFIMTPEEIRKLSLTELLSRDGFSCDCGKTHSVGNVRVLIESGAIEKIPSLLEEKGLKKPFVLSGHDTYLAAGEKVVSVLEKAGIRCSKYVYPTSPVLPTEETVGSLMMHYDFTCDCIIAVGSGVINDTGKFIARATGHEYFIVGTAPSMDGYASASSSMERDGLKVSIDTTFAHTIIGDLDILAEAPMHMLVSGVGDMLAKYISLVEWRIAHLLVGDYYCPVIAALVENALQKVVEAAPGLVTRDKDAVAKVMEGMVIAGLSMSYAGVSRPASGMEHYFSHIWDMRSLAFPEAKHDLHGIQCGYATLLSLKVWDFIKTLTPDREKALAYVRSFDPDEWNQKLLSFIGPGAQAMVDLEKKEKKYDPEKHAVRLEKIIENWDEIMKIASGLPAYEDVLTLMEAIGAPTSPHDIGYTDDEIFTTFTMTKDIRDKYIGSRLLWDLGELDNMKF